jgi:LPS O-antigen subunit length determinant protein (WzzB/FepE family)
MVRYAGDPCDELIEQYNQTMQQRQQQEWDASVAAPLRKQIADQQKQIADQQNQIQTLQVKIESQTTAALQSEARNRAALDLVGACLGVGLAFFVAFASFQRLARNSMGVKPDRERAASAGS